MNIPVDDMLVSSIYFALVNKFMFSFFFFCSFSCKGCMHFSFALYLLIVSTLMFLFLKWLRKIGFPLC